MPIVRGRNIEVLFSADMIARRNLELTKEIAAQEFHDLLVIAILKGSFIFAADLIRCMHGAGLAPEVEFILISSYGSGTESGGVQNPPGYRCLREGPGCPSYRRHSGIRQHAGIYALSGSEPGSEKRFDCRAPG